MKYKFSISMMCMNLLQMEQQIMVLNDRADFFHVDIMDGHFVGNLTLSPFFVEQTRKICKLPIDAHLMVENPADYVESLIRAGVDYITLHAETINGYAFRIIKRIKDLGCKVGIALNPETPLEHCMQYINLADKLTIMTVDPGFAGSFFIPEMIEKVRQSDELKKRHGYSYLTAVDGACNTDTFGRLAEAGAEVFILGSSSGIFSLDPKLETAWDMMLSNFIKNVGGNSCA